MAKHSLTLPRQKLVPVHRTQLGHWAYGHDGDCCDIAVPAFLADDSTENAADGGQHGTAVW